MSRISSELFGENAEHTTNNQFVKQNDRMLRVHLDNTNVMARQGSMVAYQGEMDFAFQGGGIGKFLKKAVTGEGVPLMKVSGRGDLFLADDAREIHIMNIEDSAITINGANVLAFDSSLEWDIKRVQGAGMLTGGLFNMQLKGSGWLALTAHGTPVVLRTDAPTFADMNSAVAWSASLQTAVKTTLKLGSLVGRGSGESFQLEFHGQGFVIVQASEGPTVPPHSHG